MQSNLQTLPVAEESLRRGHEVSEKRVRNVLLVGGGAAVLLIGSLAVCAMTIHLLAQTRAMQSMAPLGMISAPDLKPLEHFPKPNLQIDDDHGQMTALYASQNAKLNCYGWVDRSAGIVRIPIDQAMDLIAQRGLPARTNGVSRIDGTPLQLIQEEQQ
jgi:hypothetical protein